MMLKVHMEREEMRVPLKGSLRPVRKIQIRAGSFCILSYGQVVLIYKADEAESIPSDIRASLMSVSIDKQEEIMFQCSDSEDEDEDDGWGPTDDVATESDAVDDIDCI